LYRLLPLIYMIQHIGKLNNNCKITLTKDRYKGIFANTFDGNYEIELTRNDQTFCLYMDKNGIRDIIDTLSDFLKENEE